jgi:alginate O-acetyltransferase complex protein AlgJ
VAVQLASHLKDKDLLSPAPTVTWQVRQETNRSSGDLAAMLNLPKGQTFFPPETVPITRVVSATGQPWEPDPGAAVLLLGDSFCNIYSLASMGWGESAGFAEHLSLELGQAIDRVVINAGGAASTRQELARELATGRDRLAGKRLVIYQFAARELAFGDWKLLDLPAVASPSPAIGWTAEQGIVRGRVAAIARLPQPGSVPYRDCLVAIHLTQLRGPALGTGKAELLVYAMGMRDNRRLPIASVTVGTDLQLRLRAWSEVENRYGGLNRVELDDLDLLSLPTFWAEEAVR